jgi:hypothetical protein
MGGGVVVGVGVVIQPKNVLCDACYMMLVM